MTQKNQHAKHHPEAKTRDEKFSMETFYNKVKQTKQQPSHLSDPAYLTTQEEHTTEGTGLLQRGGKSSSAVDTAASESASEDERISRIREEVRDKEQEP